MYGKTVRNANVHPSVRIGKTGTTGALRLLKDEIVRSTLVPRRTDADLTREPGAVTVEAAEGAISALERDGSLHVAWGLDHGRHWSTDAALARESETLQRFLARYDGIAHGAAAYDWSAEHFAGRDAIGDAENESTGCATTGIKGIRNSLEQYRLDLSAMKVERAIAKVLVHEYRPRRRTNFKSWRICIEEPVQVPAEEYPV